MSLNEGRGPPCRKEKPNMSWGPPGFTKCSQMPAFKRLAGFYPPVIAVSQAEARVSFDSHIARARDQIKTAWLMLICSLHKAGRVRNFPCDFFLQKDIWPWVSFFIEVYLLVWASFLKKRKRSWSLLHRVSFKKKKYLKMEQGGCHWKVSWDPYATWHYCYSILANLTDLCKRKTI